MPSDMKSLRPYLPTKKGLPQEPGSRIVRPTRDDAERNPDQFYTLLEVVKNRIDLPHTRIAEIIGDLTDSPDQNISRKIKARSFSEDARLALLRHIFDAANLISGASRREAARINDALYFALLNFFHAKDSSQDKARARMEGTYKFWRYSAQHDGEYLFGKMHFEEDSGTRSLKATLVQAKQAHQGEMSNPETFTGYLLRLSHMYFIIFRNELTDDVRITLLPERKYGAVGTHINPRSIYAGCHKHAITLDGFGLGIDGSSGFFSPVHLSLVDDVDELAVLDDQLDVVKEGDPRLPDRVVAMLKRNGPLRKL